MAIWQFDCMLIPKGRKDSNLSEDLLISWQEKDIIINIEEFFEGMLKRENSWSKNIIQYGQNDSTCIELLLKEQKIQEISCRMDLRELAKDTLEKILGYINAINGEIYYGEDIYPADIGVVIKLISTSEAAKFCKDPKEYLDSLKVE